MNKKNILYVTAFHPGGKGFIGAGEAICEANLRNLLLSGDDIHVLCLAPGYQTENPEVVKLFNSYKIIKSSLSQTILAIIHGVPFGSLFAPWLFTRVTKKNICAIKEILDINEINEIWLDFPSTLGFSPYLDCCPINYFVHDVVSQKIGRRKILGILGGLVKKIEGHFLSYLSRCIVLSQKDEDLLREMGFTGEILLQPPGQVPIGEVRKALPIQNILAEFAGRKNLVFFGNMKRPENHWSIMHFLLFSYPKIRRCHRDVQFWVIGIYPRLTLKLFAYFLPGVRVIGAVDDPIPAFRASTLCVVPLRLGAGVKIKVLQMLDAGGKVVTSPVGSEGISSAPDLYVTPYDEIPNTICELLSQNN